MFNAAKSCYILGAPPSTAAGSVDQLNRMLQPTVHGVPRNQSAAPGSAGQPLRILQPNIPGVQRIPLTRPPSAAAAGSANASRMPAPGNGKSHDHFENH